jgi:Lipid A 3-O-deacylase (PagL)
MLRPANGLRCVLFFVVWGLLINPARAEQSFDPENIFQPMSKAISVEGALAHFGTPRMPGGYIDTWNLGVRFSLLPFGILHTTVLHGVTDGALEVGLEPIFQRFSNVHQNFGGVLFELKYYLTGLRYRRFVPWIGASIGPGGSDLDIGEVAKDSKLTGPFMALIRGEVGVAYFIDQEKAVYVGLQSQHVSNSNFNGQDEGMNTNISINTPWGVVIGLSWFFR